MQWSTHIPTLVMITFRADFAKDLRIPKFMVPPASLRIYRNSTARYATQWVINFYQCNISIRLSTLVWHTGTDQFSDGR